MIAMGAAAASAGLAGVPPLLAALPFFELRPVAEGVRATWNTVSVTIPTFGIPVDPWATLVCLGVLVGLEVGRARAIRMGFEPRDIVDGAVWTVLWGFFGAHVYTVLAYYPERLATDGIWAILRVWEGFASTGGFIGAMLAYFVFYRWIRPMPLLRMGDLIAFGFPVGWVFGRMGCAVVHDHIGAPTDFALGMWFPPDHFAAGVRHELGLYEMLLTLPLMAWFFWLGRRDQPPGTFLGWFFTLYAPVRFGLDFLRNDDLAFQDVRYLGLTPAQYGVIALFLFGVALLAQRDLKGFRPWPLDGTPDQGARAGSQAGAAVEAGA
jgi:phosphatidylglycerol:prolipoprotein diacylglycerol transferase